MRKQSSSMGRSCTSICSTNISTTVTTVITILLLLLLLLVLLVLLLLLLALLLLLLLLLLAPPGEVVARAAGGLRARDGAYSIVVLVQFILYHYTRI